MSSGAELLTPFQAAARFAAIQLREFANEAARS